MFAGLTLAEMRASFEKEKARVISEVRAAAQAELDAAVKLTKSKQWYVPPTMTYPRLSKGLQISNKYGSLTRN
jgi:hypothetical protein